MTTTRFRWTLLRAGAAGSLGWVVLAVLVAWGAGDTGAPLRPHEWAVVFAGILAPVAFLWLVLGFFLLGWELRRGTEALHMEAERLREALERQDDVVHETRRKVDASMARLARERAAKTAAAQPRFMFDGYESLRVGAAVTYNVDMLNQGNTCSELRLTYEPRADAAGLTALPSLGRGEEKSFVLHFNRGFPGDGMTIVLTFLDAMGVPGEQRHAVRATGNRLEFIRQHVA